MRDFITHRLSDALVQTFTEGELNACLAPTGPLPLRMTDSPSAEEFAEQQRFWGNHKALIAMEQRLEDFLQEQAVGESEFAQIRNEIIQGNASCFEPFVNAIADVITTQQNEKGEVPIHYIGLGPGTGDRDKEILIALGDQFGMERLYYSGIDPYVVFAEDVLPFYQSLPAFQLIQAGLATGQNYIALLQANQVMGATGPEAITVATARFVFHHMATSFEQFTQDVAGIPTVLLEEPVDYRDRSARLSMLAIDILANLAFTPDWIEASRKQGHGFHANYLTADAARAAGGGKGIFIDHPFKSPTAILTI